MIFRIRLESEGGMVDHVRRIESILARNRIDIAAVACRAKTERIENRDSLGITTLDVADYRIPADEPIESKHWRCRTCAYLHPAFQRGAQGLPLLIIRLSGAICMGSTGAWVICPKVGERLVFVVWRAAARPALRGENRRNPSEICKPFRRTFPPRADTLEEGGTHDTVFQADVVLDAAGVVDPVHRLFEHVRPRCFR